MSSQDYIVCIKDLLEKKRAKNPHYSLRALARDINVQASSLTNILQGKKEVTPQIAYRIGTHMKLDGSEMLNFIAPTLQ